MQQPFCYKDQSLYLEGVSVSAIAKQFGTPCFAYSQTQLEKNLAEFSAAFAKHAHLICYAVKANSNLAILQLLAKNNSGFDIVSQGELERVLIAGGRPEQIFFSGVGKSHDEISRALAVGIHCFNIESIAELMRLQEIAASQNKIASIALRINPDIPVQTHPHIATGLKENKFGLAYENFAEIILILKTCSHLRMVGLACHIGSQLLELEPFIAAIERLTPLLKQLQTQGFNLEHINIGGGLGVTYQNEIPPSISDYVKAITLKLAEFNLKIIIEPGRALVANTGLLLTKVEYIKNTPTKNFLIVDTAMNDLMRPALYDAWHDILPVNLPTSKPTNSYDIVGPICESADFLGKNRFLTAHPQDILAITMVGAYGFSMSSNYNSRPKIAEVLVKDDQMHLIREREKLTDLWQLEKLL
jgi:diaminopimelate decarboxylase